MDKLESLNIVIDGAVQESNKFISQGFALLLTALTEIAEHRKPSQEQINKIIHECEKHSQIFARLSKNAHLLNDALIDEHEAKLAVDDICEKLACELE